MKDEIAIIEAWAEAHASLGSSTEPSATVRERAQRDLDTAYNRMIQLAPDLRPPVTLQTVLLRLFFRHVPVTLAVRLLRYVYYSTLVLALIWGLVGFSQPTSWSTGNAIFTTLMTYFIVAVVPALLAARLVTYVARRQAADTPTPTLAKEGQATPPYGPPGSQRHAADEMQG